MTSFPHRSVKHNNPPHSEHGLPDSETLNPVLRVGGSDSSWKEAGKAYLDQIGKQLKPPGKDLEEIAARVAPADATDAVRAAALASYVQRTLNYHAVEFGVRGRIPRPAAETLKRKQGDCKDHSVLLHQLLTAAGIPSQLVLVHTSWAVHEEMPTLDQFNHMIVRIPALDPCEYVDPTAKSAQPGELVPWGLWDRFGLVLDRDGPELVKLPSKPDHCASLHISRDIEIGESGLTVEEKVVFGGYYAQWMRDYFAGQPETRYLQRLQGLFSPYGAYQLESVEFPDPTNPGHEALLRIRYQMAAEPDGKLTLPDVWERNYLEIAFMKDRKEPFEWQLPTRIHSDIRLTGPTGFSKAYLDGLRGGANNEFCQWKREAAADGDDSIRIRYDFKTGAKIWPAERYARLRDAWQAGLAALRRRVGLAE